tara:strand:+ start:5530 stop:6204 length:675 start_codon:yes stop_codon:yes gene_type:complete
MTKSKYKYKDKNFIVRNETSDSFVVREVLSGAYNKLNLKKNDVCLDIGLNIGAFSVYASDKCKLIISYEPDKENFELAVKNLHINNCYNVKPFNYAVTGTDEAIRSFSVNVKKNKGAHSLIPKKGRTQSLVNCININKIIQKYNPTVMKIDTEGAEYEILKSINNFDNFRELIFEFHHAHLDDIKTRVKYKDIINHLKTKFTSVDYRAETKGAWVTNVYCKNER